MKKSLSHAFLLVLSLVPGIAMGLPCGSFSISSSTYSYRCPNGNQYMASATTVHCADGTSHFYGWIDDCDGIFFDTDIAYFKVAKQTSSLDSSTLVSYRKARDSRGARLIWSDFEKNWKFRKDQAGTDGRYGGLNP